MTTKVKIANGKTWVGNSEGNAVERAAALLPGEWEVGKVPTSTETVGEFTWGDGGGGGSDPQFNGEWITVPSNEYVPTIASYTFMGAQCPCLVVSSPTSVLIAGRVYGMFLRITILVDGGDNRIHRSCITNGEFYDEGMGGYIAILEECSPGSIGKVEYWKPYNYDFLYKSPTAKILKINSTITCANDIAYVNAGDMYYVLGDTGTLPSEKADNIVIALRQFNTASEWVGIAWATVHPRYTAFNCQAIRLAEEEEDGEVVQA